MSRVVITGAGTINALGSGVETFADGLRAGRCAIETLTLFSTEGARTHLAAEVRNLTAPDWLPRNLRRRASRSDLMALIAAHEALLSAQIHSIEQRRSLAIVTGGTTGGMFESEDYLRRRLLGDRTLPNSGILNTPSSSSGGAIAHHFLCEGPRLTVSTACSSGANALGIAADWIRSGRTEQVLCGGVDSLCRLTFSGFNSLQAIDEFPCRPFDRRRAGLTLGEGAAMFVMESEEHARARGATVMAEFVGYGVSADAYHITQPHADGAGAQLALRRALAESRVTAEEIDYVNAHGTATPVNDRIETAALKAVLGKRAYEIPISSTKSMIGHTLAGAGAIEALACVLALRDQFVPPTANWQEADPDCDLDYVPRQSRKQPLRTILSNSYGFGGNNTTIVLRHAN